MVEGLRFGVQGVGLGVQCLGFRVKGSWFKVQASGFLVQDLGFRIVLDLEMLWFGSRAGLGLGSNLGGVLARMSIYIFCLNNYFISGLCDRVWAEPSVEIKDRVLVRVRVIARVM